MRIPRALPPLPRGIRVLRDAVIVMACLAAGAALGTLPYAGERADPRTIEAFQAVCGTLGFTLVAFLATSRRALHLALTVLAVWAIAGVQVAAAGQHALWWALQLAELGLMALLGAALALLLERLVRD